MDTQQIAHRLVELCRQGKFEEAYQELFSPEAVGLEPPFLPNPETQGLPALLAKSAAFGQMIEAHYGVRVSDPLVAGSYFTVTMWQDVQFKGQPRRQEDELCLYEVRDGKIVKEQFFH
ncbi:MAG: nuclear transport factor 2 family protein [Bernardetiaceae bacterium]|nr:nuclear transport factor 2 family protein [Bernardetiaceae bacterium]